MLRNAVLFNIMCLIFSYVLHTMKNKRSYFKCYCTSSILEMDYAI